MKSHVKLEGVAAIAAVAGPPLYAPSYPLGVVAAPALYGPPLGVGFGAGAFPLGCNGAASFGFGGCVPLGFGASSFPASYW